MPALAAVPLVLLHNPSHQGGVFASFGKQMFKSTSITIVSPKISIKSVAAEHKIAIEYSVYDRAVLSKVTNDYIVSLSQSVLLPSASMNNSESTASCRRRGSSTASA